AVRVCRSYLRLDLQRFLAQIQTWPPFVWSESDLDELFWARRRRQNGGKTESKFACNQLSYPYRSRTGVFAAVLKKDLRDHHRQVRNFDCANLCFGSKFVLVKSRALWSVVPAVMCSWLL